MRDIAITIVVLIGVAWTVRYPFVGILLWAWITLMDPHQMAFGFSRTLQINLLVAVVTLGSWLVSKERKAPPADATTVLVLVFMAWCTINTFMAVEPFSAWTVWDRTWRIVLFGVMVSILATDRVRIHALIMVYVMSLLWFGTKGGGFTLMTGGGNHVGGPPNSAIGDNNQLALAILMALPLANYLRMQSANLLVRRVILAAMALSVVSILGSYSRGAFVALGGLLVVGFFRSKKKWVYPLIAALIIVPALQFMPDSFSDRMGTIKTVDDDASFQGRVDAWHVATGFAIDHFPIGAGFDGPQKPWIFGHYEPGKNTHAAHSIYFEVLGDNGFAGLSIYIALLASCFRASMIIRRKAKKRPELSWAYDLAGMLQLTLFVFCLGGAALSFAYYDGLFVCAGLLSAMREVVQRSMAPGWRGTDYQMASALPASGFVAER